MIEIISILKNYPIAFLVLICVLFIVVFVLVYKLTKHHNKQAPLPCVELHLFELTAKQLIAFQSLIGEMIYRHKTVIADSLEDSSKTFLEDINAAVELNNQKKEQQLKDALLKVLTDKRQIVATDILNLKLATKQLEMLSSKEMTECVAAIKDKVGTMLEHTTIHVSFRRFGQKSI